MTVRTTFTGLLMGGVAVLMLVPVVAPWPLLGRLIGLVWAVILVTAVARPQARAAGHGSCVWGTRHHRDLATAV